MPESTGLALAPETLLTQKFDQILQDLNELNVKLATLDDQEKKNLLQIIEGAPLARLEAIKTAARSLCEKVRNSERERKIAIVYTHRGNDGYSYHLEKFPSKRNPAGIHRWCRIKNYSPGSQREKLGLDSIELRKQYGLDAIPDLPIFTQPASNAFHQVAAPKPKHKPAPQEEQADEAEVQELWVSYHNL